MRLAMKPFGYLILFYFGKYKHRILFMAYGSFEVLKVKAQVLTYAIDIWISECGVEFPTDLLWLNLVYIWKFLKVIRIAFDSSVLEIFGARK